MSCFRIRLAPVSLFLFGFLAIFAQGARADRTLSVIFIHTGGSERGSGDGEAIANLLRKNGFYVRGIDNLTDTEGGAGVDYFSTEDKGLATAVAKIVTEGLGAGAAPVLPRFQSKVANPPGFLGVWLYDPGTAANTPPADWTSPPKVAWCYQEHNLKLGQYLVACHFNKANCQQARGPNNPTPGTNCKYTDLSSASWSPKPKGFLNSWFQNSQEPFPDPFPQINESDLLQ